MQIIKKINDLRIKIKEAKKNGKSVGFVPTMGFLHEGHLSLIEEARKNNDLVVVSIFVNPTQFGPDEDLETYPRDLEKDSELCRDAGVDFIFNPEVDEMYVEGYSTYVNIESDITKKLCGASRDGHFKGVTSVVSKLFNIVNPDSAYFGMKDYQQLAVINKMVRDLNFDINIVGCPIIREKDGLALSSRNTYLTEEQRKDALVLNKSLKEAKELILAGEQNKKVIIDGILDKIKKISYSVVDYVEMLDAKNLNEIEIINRSVVIALAVNVGKPRLIDNIVVEVK